MWVAIAVISGIASLAGYGLVPRLPAGHRILTMLSETMMPEAFEHGGKWVGVATTLGFAVAFTVHTLD